MPRLFFAVQTPEAIRAALRRPQDALLETLGRDRLRLEHLENSHVTLAFLGEVPSETVQALIAAATQTFHEAAVEPFELHVTDVQPNDTRRPKVIWANVQPQEPLRRLHVAAVDAALRCATDEHARIAVDEKPFRPHLTLARFRDPVRLQNVKMPAPAEVRGTIDEAVLIESVLGSGAPKHSVIARFPLG